MDIKIILMLLYKPSTFLKGWDDNGNVSLVPGATRYFPLHVIESSLMLLEAGSTYDVAFVKHNDLPICDNAQAAKNDLNLSVQMS